MSTKVACVVFAFALLIAAALLFAGVFKATGETHKTFAGAHFIHIPQGFGGFLRNDREESNGRVSNHTLVVSCGDAGRARRQGNAL